MIAKQRSSTMEIMEHLLSDWIDDLHRKKTPMSLSLIQEKAKSLYDDLKKRDGESSTVKKETFKASRGWFHRFQKHANLHNVNLTGEAASVDEEAAVQLKKIISEVGYSPKQVFNVDKVGLYWKKMSTRTYISRDEKTAPGFKASKDCLSFLFGEKCRR
ncbi:tigger transposable element derived 1 [Chelydra serpentina]|uniref:Tigger transposable element derived 1 n=1 Tax=Chelydra serpentina TaxID=8475 RepID=A0A8T1S7R7_CHESE|nr:tigger transposable element derived 1 [Chelydra serpentina]